MATDLSAGRQPDRRVLTLSDGYRTSLYVHRRRGATARPVVYLHGIQSHPGWFAGSAAMLADRGHPVYQVTRRGSGDNTVDRGHATSARQLLSDVQTAVQYAIEDSNRDDVALLGVSWGGKLAAATCLWPKRTVPVASLTMVAPGIVPRVNVSIGTKLAVVSTCVVWPKCQLAIPLNDVSLFTDNPEMRAYLGTDDLRLHRATSRFMLASRCLDRMVGRAREGNVGVPTSLILASRDRIIDNEATQDTVRELAGDDARIMTIDSSHVLEFEPSTTEFFNVLAEAIGR